MICDVCGKDWLPPVRWVALHGKVCAKCLNQPKEYKLVCAGGIFQLPDGQCCTILDEHDFVVLEVIHDAGEIEVKRYNDQGEMQ